MKKILTILLILPFFSFAQCLEITEENLIGKSFDRWDRDNMGLIFDSGGFFRIRGKEKSDYRWFLADVEKDLSSDFNLYSDKLIFFYDESYDGYLYVRYNDWTVSHISLSKKKLQELVEILMNKNRKENFTIGKESWTRNKDLTVLSNGINKWVLKNHYIDTDYKSGIVYDDFWKLNVKNIFRHTKECIDKFYTDNYNSWKMKGEYEKSEDYKNRVTEISKKNKSESLMKEALRLHKEFAVKSFNNSKGKTSDKIVIKDYSADNETFLIEIKNFEPINFPISISEAESFKKNFYPTRFSDLELHYLDGKFLVSEITINDYKYTLFAE